VRSRDIQKAAILEGTAPAIPAEDLLVDQQCQALARLYRAERRKNAKTPHEAKGLKLPPYKPLKRGPKPDPFRDKCVAGWHTQLTVRESNEIDLIQAQIAPNSTRSVFLRWLICEALEANRDKSIPRKPFEVDLSNLDRRSVRAWRTARSAGRLAA